MYRHSWLSLILGILIVLLASRANAQRIQFENQVQERVVELLQFDADADRDAIEDQYYALERFANTVASRAGVRQLGAMVRCEGALGVIRTMLIARENDATGLGALFIDHPSFMDELGLLVSDEDNASGVLALARRLMEERSTQVKRYPALAAALCVVHDMQDQKPYSRWVNEHTPVSSDPLEIFDFYVLNANTMYIRPDALPALALVYVVDVTETPQQLQWAHDRYRRNPAIKDRFFEIEYDYEHFRQEKPKKVVSAPGEFNLEKILRYGGVCADQAYFAMSVAKACGVPSSYIIARGADLSHAWVGFVEMRGRRAEWDFDAGRYTEYKKLRGNMVNPQLRADISDGRAGILGAAMSSKNEEVLASLAASRVVERMNARQWKLDESVELDARGNLRKPRTDSVDDRLALLRATLSKSAGVPSAWDQVVAMATAGELDEKQMDVWARAVMQLAGRQHQDFAFDFLTELIGTIGDPQRQHAMWEWAYGQFRARPDLAAAVRFRQGELWVEHENLDYAWLAYNDVIQKFINDGPMVNEALSSIGKLLARNNKRDKYLGVLQDAARRVTRPDDISAGRVRYTNYYRINWRLVKELEHRGRNAEANQLRKAINMPADE